MNAMNNFTISGFVVNDAKVKNFEKASVARFGLSFRTTEKKGDQEVKKSSILDMETWIKKDDTATIDMLKKGIVIHKLSRSKEEVVYVAIENLYKFLTLKNVNVYLYIGIIFAEIHQTLAYVSAYGRHRSNFDSSALSSCKVFHSRLRLVQGLKNFFCIRQKFLSGLGERNAPAVSRDQLYPQLIFKALDILRYSRLRNIEYLCRLCVIICRCDRIEYFQLYRFHHTVTLSAFYRPFSYC